ncbi:hypothetical protein B0H12DRAFT_1082784 [Mycena haematopus]|nr:hypothetical protein B0H12DRAFT_1082784 [Mycena haematopus]
MPKEFEILHSGQYWQDVRRRAKEAKAAREAAQERAETFAPHPSDGGHVYTFVPGRATPITSVQQRDGKLHHLSGPSRTAQHTAPDLAAIHKQRHRIEELGRVTRAKKLEEDAAAVDAALLARLKGGGPSRTAQCPAAELTAADKQRRRIGALVRFTRAEQLKKEAATEAAAAVAASNGPLKE